MQSYTCITYRAQSFLNSQCLRWWLCLMKPVIGNNTSSPRLWQLPCGETLPCSPRWFLAIQICLQVFTGSMVQTSRCELRNSCQWCSSPHWYNMAFHGVTMMYELDIDMILIHINMVYIMMYELDWYGIYNGYWSILISSNFMSFISSPLCLRSSTSLNTTRNDPSARQSAADLATAKPATTGVLRCFPTRCRNF